MASISLYVPAAGETPGTAGLCFEEYADPTGGGQATRSISWKDADGNVVARMGGYIVKHADGGLIYVYGPTGHVSGAIFELDDHDYPTAPRKL